MMCVETDVLAGWARAFDRGDGDRQGMTVVVSGGSSRPYFAPVVLADLKLTDLENFPLRGAGFTFTQTQAGPHLGPSRLDRLSMPQDAPRRPRPTIACASPRLGAEECWVVGDEVRALQQLSELSLKPGMSGLDRFGDANRPNVLQRELKPDECSPTGPTAALNHPPVPAAVESRLSGYQDWSEWTEGEAMEGEAMWMNVVFGALRVHPLLRLRRLGMD